MADKHTDVLVAGYREIAGATRDFEALVTLVKDKKVRVEGAILVTHDADGHVVVEQTGDSLGRKGLGWHNGVGFLVGLAAPPLLASVAPGADDRGVIAKFIQHRLQTGISEKIGKNPPPGSAAIIATFDPGERLGVERALVGAVAKSVVETEKSGLAALKASLAQAMGKFKPDRSILPIPDRNFGGSIGRTLKDSVPDWSMMPGAKAPEGAPNVLLVLIDDAGFGGPDTFGGPLSTPTFSRIQKMGLTYNRFHVTAVCSPTRACSAYRTQPTPRGLSARSRNLGDSGLHGRQAA